MPDTPDEQAIEFANLASKAQTSQSAEPKLYLPNKVLPSSSIKREQNAYISVDLSKSSIQTSFRAPLTEVVDDEISDNSRQASVDYNSRVTEGITNNVPE